VSSVRTRRPRSQDGFVVTAHGEGIVSFDGLQLVLPPEAVAALVAEVKREVLAELASGRDEPEWLTVAAAATYLGRTPQAVHKPRQRGELRCRKPNGRLLFSRAELRRYVETSPERT
jgi:hypothetical protein